MQHNARYLSNLTPLRGIAALLVAVFHFEMVAARFVPATTTLFLEKSYIMVDLFFIMSGFIMLHVCVIVHFLIRRRSGRWILHGAGPLIGIVSVLTVLSGMSELAVTLGLSWIAGGLVYGLVLKVRRKSAPLPISSTGCG